ncbi:MAG: D-glycero-beta-D-manno-heptose 1-phosphate adenylyltransferase [Planctomycetota bacterium]|nr:D-glycero-beta-D-manno-heptose 1-phosphate adenylyltransferase [Planctomycetota bacterium]
MEPRLIQIVEDLPASNVLLVGDMMLDKYLYGNAERVSPEAPVLVLHYQNEELRLGGAANVASMLATLGAKVRAVGVVGRDAAAEDVRRLMRKVGIDPAHLIEADDRPTTCKLRLVGAAQHRHAQQLMRLDFENAKPVSQGVAEALLARVEAAIADCKIVCIEDYNKGAVPAAVCQGIIASCNRRGIPVLVDPAQIPDYSKYKGATAIKLNRPEAERASGMLIQGEADYQPAAEKLLNQLELGAVILTLDRHGAYLATRDGERRWLKHARPRQVFDATGAGDMVLAMLAAARAGGASWVEAVALGNVAAGLEVERFGTVPIKPAEIIQELQSLAHDRIGKERSLEVLCAELDRHRASGRRIVFTNGCFDLIHLGHIKYFQFARAQGDLLVVGVNTDASIQRLKGLKRPIINESDRLGVLEELESIDYLVRFDDDTPLRLIQHIRPDVLVKGADYKKEKVVGWDLVESWGGQVALAPLVDGRSTSAVIQRILETQLP